jgi:serine phosphatase RsbU (regulator of sigma subunit)
MDLSVCVIDRKQKTIEFAGANNPLVYIKDDEVSVIKGDRYSIGGIQKEAERRFTPHTIKVDKPTCFYIFSDGYTDQFGGEKGRSFLLKNFKELLLSIHKEPMEKQRQMLADHFMEWKGNEDQIDDVIVIGFKLG